MESRRCTTLDKLFGIVLSVLWIVLSGGSRCAAGMACCTGAGGGNVRLSHKLSVSQILASAPSCPSGKARWIRLRFLVSADADAMDQAIGPTRACIPRTLALYFVKWLTGKCGAPRQWFNSS
jgi:hypothetical protein